MKEAAAAVQSQLEAAKGAAKKADAVKKRAVDDHAARTQQKLRKVESRLKDLDAEKGAAIAREVKAAAKARKEAGKKQAFALMQQAMQKMAGGDASDGSDDED